MENGSFQAPFSELSNLEFNEESFTVVRHHSAEPVRASGNVATANRTLPPSRSSKSSSLDAVLAQNEDLMARLKVSMRRLDALEHENETLRDNEGRLHAQYTSLSDQMLVWKEKENFWHQKNQRLEQDMLDLKNRFPEFELFEEKLDRYKKYHEKVRLQVKPYIQQLKSYAQNLTLEIRKLNTELEHKEMALEDNERRLRDLRRASEEQLLKQDQQSRELVRIFESEKERVRTEIAELHKVNAQLEMKAQRLDHVLMKQDELENTMIALRRTKEENEVRFREVSRNQSLELQNLRNESTEAKIKIEDLQNQTAAQSEEALRQSRRAETMEEQLTSLRFLWSKKCEEAEKMQGQMQALEKLNHELSQKLNQARKGEVLL